MTEEQENEQPKSFLLVKFADVASVQFEVKLHGVTPYQLLSLVGYLEVMAKNQIVQAENTRFQREQEQALVAPPSKIVIPGRD